MATLDDLKPIFESIQDSSEEQASLLKSFIQGQEREAKQGAAGRSTSGGGSREGTTIRGGISRGVEGGLGGILGGIATGVKLFAGLGGAAVGLGAIGVGLGTFFTALSGADNIIGKLGDGENLKNLLTNVAGGIEAFTTQNLLTLGGLFTGSALFALIKGGAGAQIYGIAAIGTGLAAFFTAFSAADALIEKYGGDGSTIKTVAQNVADTISIFTTNGAEGGVFAALLAAGALFGVLGTGKGKGLKGVFTGLGGKLAKMSGAITGAAAIGFGIGSFFLGFAGAEQVAKELGITNMAASSRIIKNTAQNMYDTVAIFTGGDITGTVLSGLFAAGGIFGAITGGAALTGRLRTAGVTGGALVGLSFGVGAVGFAIGSFFLGFAAAEVLLKKIDENATDISDGSRIKTISENLIAAFKIFSDNKGLASLFAAGGILGSVAGAAVAIPGGQAVAGAAALAVVAGAFGLGVAGLALGSFFVGFSIADKAATFVGSDGTTAKKIMVHMAEGISAFSTIDPDHLGKFGVALGKLGVGMGAFFLAEGLGFASASIDTVGKMVGNIISFFRVDTNLNKSPIEAIVDGIQPITELENNKIEKIGKLGDALDNLFRSFRNFSNIGRGVMGTDLTRTVQGISTFLVSMNAMLYGGPAVIKEGGSRSGETLKFGGGLVSLTDAELGYVKEGIQKIYDTFGFNSAGGSTAVLNTQRLRSLDEKTLITNLKLSQLVEIQEDTLELLERTFPAGTSQVIIAPNNSVNTNAPTSNVVDNHFNRNNTDDLDATALPSNVN